MAKKLKYTHAVITQSSKNCPKKEMIKKIKLCRRKQKITTIVLAEITFKLPTKCCAECRRRCSCTINRCRTSILFVNECTNRFSTFTMQIHQWLKTTATDGLTYSTNDDAVNDFTAIDARLLV